MKRSIAIAIVLLLVASGASAWSMLRRAATGADMTAAARQFVASLGSAQQAKALMAYDSPERVDWHFIPKPERKGLQIREMDDKQRTAAHALLRSALSQVGYDKATKIMDLENLLIELERKRVDGPLRDPERYYFTVFGKPTDDGRWGLSVEGHHLSLNFVVESGKVISSTPSVFAANPAIVKSDAVPRIKPGTRILEREETLAFDLLKSLSSEQRHDAVIAAKAPAEIRAAGEPQPPTDAPAGIAAAKFTDAQTSTLRELIAEYAHDMPSDVAAARLGAIESAGFDKVHFAWAGANEPGIGHYYRLQGPTFLIEFVNVQPDAAGNPANHIHCVWRDMAGDFALPVSSAPLKK
ncbi:MAG TPA: DUF3500 domain-containing protein [Pirellulales bacterium]|nr:DUF3500 domain-containing protein [Pirellulales bacterium]